MAKSIRIDDSAFERENKTAVSLARKADRIEPRAAAVSYDAELRLVLVYLRNGFVFGFPPSTVSGLQRRTAKQLAAVRISPSGDGLHWDGLNAEASLTGLMRDALNLEEWAPRLMGQSRSAAKAQASRVNGLKGGRPRRAPQKSVVKRKRAE
jgi:hypothetical protein